MSRPAPLRVPLGEREWQVWRASLTDCPPSTPAAREYDAGQLIAGHRKV